MNKKAEFMSFINMMKSYDGYSKDMGNFLIEVIELSLTEERVKDPKFLKEMIKLTDKYIMKNDINRGTRKSERM